ncbi:MAG: hypothetical protein LC750_07625 [Actinobacteria bacterium]|nr:hypothetical protein [Actinomycetota bacterium]
MTRAPTIVAQSMRAHLDYVRRHPPQTNVDEPNRKAGLARRELLNAFWRAEVETCVARVAAYERRCEAAA